jgi:hypothetical protein
MEKREALFIRLIIRTFQLVFSVRTVFFSYDKSANSIFQPAYSTAERSQRLGKRIIGAEELREIERERERAAAAERSWERLRERRRRRGAEREGNSAGDLKEIITLLDLNEHVRVRA